MRKLSSSRENKAFSVSDVTQTTVQLPDKYPLIKIVENNKKPCNNFTDAEMKRISVRLKELRAGRVSA